MRKAGIIVAGIAFVLVATWLLIQSPPRETPIRMEVENSIKGRPDLRLITQSSEFMRDER